MAWFIDPIRRNSLIIGIVGVLLIAASSFFFIRTSNRFFIRLMGENLIFAAADLAADLDGDAHARLRTPTDMDSAAYTTISNMLERIRTYSKSIVDTYTVRMVDGELQLILSPPVDYDHNGKIEGELEERDDIGTPYGEDPEPEMVGAFNGKSTAAKGFSDDRWGTWLTACAPIRTSAGLVDGAVCVDESAHHVRGQMRQVMAMTVALATIASGLLILMLISYLRARTELAGRRRAERQREEALQRFEGAMEATPMVATQGFSPDGHILYWNPASEQLYGHSRTEVIGKLLADLLLAPEEVKKFQELLDDIVAGHVETKPREWTVRHQDGTTRHVLSSMFPIREQGTISTIFCMDVDVTAEHQARSDLKKQLQLMERFNQAAMGREMRILELKAEINTLLKTLGRTEKFTIV